MDLPGGTSPPRPSDAGTPDSHSADGTATIGESPFAPRQAGRATGDRADNASPYTGGATVATGVLGTGGAAVAGTASGPLYAMGGADIIAEMERVAGGRLAALTQTTAAITKRLRITGKQPGPPAPAVVPPPTAPLPPTCSGKATGRGKGKGRGRGAKKAVKEPLSKDNIVAHSIVWIPVFKAWTREYFVDLALRRCNSAATKVGCTPSEAKDLRKRVARAAGSLYDTKVAA